jgi:hypothetical protein
VADADAFLIDHADTRTRFDRVAALVEGFESPFGLELLSTVHWVATRSSAREIEAITAAVYDWGERKKRFSPRQIGLAFDVLVSKGWVPSHDHGHV